jgi:hypothetical protein
MPVKEEVTGGGETVEVVTEEESPPESEMEERSNEAEVGAKLNVVDEDVDDAVVPEAEKVVGTMINVVSVVEVEVVGESVCVLVPAPALTVLAVSSAFGGAMKQRASPFCQCDTLLG